MFDRLVKSHLEAVNLELAVGGEGEQLVLRVQLPAHRQVWIVAASPAVEADTKVSFIMSISSKVFREGGIVTLFNLNRLGVVVDVDDPHPLVVQVLRLLR